MVAHRVEQGYARLDGERSSALPLILSAIGHRAGSGYFRRGRAASASGSRIPVPRTPPLIPTPRRKPRRENPDVGRLLPFIGSYWMNSREILPFHRFC